ncbi:hypothetical protein [Curtobacterium sp. 1544]|jgi:hypothetical protein|uniref:hypothetical protein n=1 Tax=Curtobacterium sp. 1544 TaxID=3156417 RepID=UPI00339A2744
MAEPLTLLGAAFTGALTGRLRSLSSWLVANTVSVALLALLGGVILENTSGRSDELVLAPATAAHRVLHVLGVTDTSALDAVDRWLQRPEFAPVALAAAVVAGVLVFLPARYTDEVAWALVVPASVAVGRTGLGLAVGSLIATTAVLAAVSSAVPRPDAHAPGRRWLGPTWCLEVGLRGAFSFAMTPFTVVIRLVLRLVDSVTFERESAPLADGARTIRPGDAVSR